MGGSYQNQWVNMRTGQVGPKTSRLLMSVALARVWALGTKLGARDLGL